MDYDVLILGGGIKGCAIAYELSKYNLNIALIEKDYDIADDIALINTAIVYDGTECSDTLMAKLEFMGNAMFEELAQKFNISFKRCGSLITAEGEKSEKKLDAIYERAVDRGIEYVKLLREYEIRNIEPNLNSNIKKAIYSPNIGIVCPYDLAIAFGEVAFDNGVIFRLEEEVLDIEKLSKGVKVTTNKNKFTCRMVVNTTPGENYSIEVERKISNSAKEYKNYFIVDDERKNRYSNIVFSLRENGDTVYYLNSMSGQEVLAVKSDNMLSIDDTLKRASVLLEGLEIDNIDSFYVSPFTNETIVIDDSYLEGGYINITGNHYGEVTMAPSIAKMVCETLVNNLNCKLRKDFNDRRRDVYRFKELSDEEKNRVIKMDKRYGNIICLCQQITEGEIVDCIRRPLGARTVEGIKRRTGVTLGHCKGSYCQSKIISILARETNKQITEIVKDSKKSKMVMSRIKEFNNI